MIAFVAQHRHFIDHLAPVYHALGGDFYVRPKLYGHARSLGVEATSYTEKVAPISRRSLAVVASRGDYFRLPKEVRVVYMAHGNGQGFVTGEHNGYAGGHGLDDVVQFLSPNEHNAEAWRRNYPGRNIDVIGCPKLDVLPERDQRERPTVCVSFHWDSRKVGNRIRETWTAWECYCDAVANLAVAERPYDLIVHGHPKMAKGLRFWASRIGLEWVQDFRDVLARADLYVNDCSSTLYEAATVMPVVVLNIPEYRREVEHGLRFWQYADVGPQVDYPENLRATIQRALEPNAAGDERRREIVAAVYPHRGEAAARAAALIRERHAEGVELGHLDALKVSP